MELNKNKLIGIGAAAIAVIVLIIVIFGNKKINLNDYVELKAEGYDGVGKVVADFDEEKFEKDTNKKIKLKNMDKEEKAMISMFYDSLAEVLLDSGYIDCELDKETGLANGDTVVLTWDCDDEKILEHFGVKVTYKDIKYKVKGLVEVPTFDPFENVTVEVEGVSGNADAEVINESGMEMTITPSYRLSNGDIVTVRLANSSSTDFYESFIEKHGKIPVPVEKEYKVEGLSEYVKSSSDLSVSAIETIKSDAERVFDEYVAEVWEEECTVVSKKNLGYYLCVAEEDSYLSAQNKLYMAYKITVNVNLESKEINDTFDYYTFVCYENVSLYDNGDISVNTERTRVADSRFYKSYGGFWGPSYYFKGYENIEDISEYVSGNNSYNYEIEDNIIR